ncbi:peptidoglycan DD-metalloendopeptidase family protein [Patescibacteria group bacterium]|nr:peptidoglycan DD-metalloendopeptidase family protein [Patescibacteria group bacterium]
MGGIFLFASSPSSASIIAGAQVNDTNSQRVDVLTVNYAVEIPEAIGGPNEPTIDNRLALLSPQVGIITGATSMKNVEIDPDGIIVYVVQDGDTLSEIAESFDVSVNTIKWENNLSNTIKPGQELRILPVSGVRHTIAKGDTFGKIAEMYDVEVEDITVFNDIDATKLVPGKKIMIPNGTVRTVVKSSSSSTKSSSKSSSVSSVSSSVSDGYYIRPTSGPVTSPFGPRKATYHYGIDIAPGTGTPIVAAADGTVIKTTCGSGYGKCLIIQHANGTQSLYAHASALYVDVGTNVKQGQKIAAVGSTGNSTGPHLHFEIREPNGKKRNVNFLK